MQNNKRFLSTAVRALGAAVTCVALASPAWASFTADYAPANWSTSNSNGGNGSVVADANTLQLTSSDFSLIDADPTDSTLSYSITATSAVTLSFSWLYSTTDFSSSYDIFGYTIDGVFTQLSTDGLSYLDTQSGTVSVSLAAGSTFAFEFISTDSEGGSASATVSDFNAVPEPGSIALMAAGLGALGWVRRRRG